MGLTRSNAVTTSGLIDPLWSTIKIAEYFGVETSTVLRWLQDGDMEGKKINNRWKVYQSEVYRYRDEKFAEGAPA
jgi:excisionase family DNA binding protein